MSKAYEKHVRLRARRFGHNVYKCPYTGEWQCEDLMNRPINAWGSLERINAFLDYLEAEEPWRDTEQYEQPTANIIPLPGTKKGAAHA